MTMAEMAGQAQSRRRRRLAWAGAVLALAPLAARAEPAVVSVPTLGLAAATKAADAALRECRRRGALVAVAVADRAGNVLALLRDPLAGAHTADTAMRKAWTAVSFRAATSALERATAPGTESNAIRQLPGVAMIGGGVPLAAAGQQVGAVAVSGAPNGSLDEACASAGAKAIADELELGS